MARLRGIARFWQAEMKMTCIEEKVSVYTDESNMTRGTASHLFCSFLFFVASFWLQKKLFGKTFWNKVVKKKRCGRSYWRVPRCNPLKDKDIVSYRTRCPPCRRFRRRAQHSTPLLCSCPPCRRFRRLCPFHRNHSECCPPCRRFRRQGLGGFQRQGCCPPCRRFRRGC